MKRYTQKTIKFYNDIANTYIKSDAAVVLKDKIDRFIKLLPGKKVLDVACGPGHDTDYLTKKGLDCVGIDLSEKMIDLAQKNFKGLKGKETFARERQIASACPIWQNASKRRHGGVA